MNKLEIKHIAAYLPYELEVKANDTVAPGVMVSIVAGMPGLLLYDDKDNIEYYELSAIKPLLIPLSELKNLDNYTLIQFIKKQTGLQIDYELDIEVDVNKQQSIWMPIPKVIEVYNILLQHHYDVFGLIDAGLALNKLDYIK